MVLCIQMKETSYNKKRDILNFESLGVSQSKIICIEKGPIILIIKTRITIRATKCSMFYSFHRTGLLPNITKVIVK